MENWTLIQFHPKLKILLWLLTIWISGLRNQVKTCISIFSTLYSSIFQSHDMSFHGKNMSCLMTKPTKWHVRPAKTEQPEHPLPIECTAKTDQTGWMPRLIWVFAGRTVILLVLSWGSSFKEMSRKYHNNKWATSWQKPVYVICEQQRSISACSLISVFVIRCLDGRIPIDAVPKISRL